jgi:hypothetical protein
MKKVLIAIAAAICVSAMTLATSGGAVAHPVRHYRHWVNPWSNPNFWGYGSWSHGGWGLGGPADWAFVGGALIPVTPYGPYPYGPFAHGAYR